MIDQGKHLIYTHNISLLSEYIMIKTYPSHIMIKTDPSHIMIITYPLQSCD